MWKDFLAGEDDVIMTSIVKKVLRSSTRRQKRSVCKTPSNGSTAEEHGVLPPPQAPPSPDLTGLTPEEIAVLKEVMRRQEEFEYGELSRQKKLRDSLLTFEEEVKRHASQKGKLKHIDLRLCRLCFKTKFADGIGKVCSDCHKRVCNRCGSFSNPTWSVKKQKHVKGKWRCTMCQMKRDVVAMTGIWYHGNEAAPEAPVHRIKSKISVSEMESSENDGTHRRFSETDGTFEGESGDRYGSDVFSPSVPTKQILPTSFKKPIRGIGNRRSTSLTDADAIAGAVDDDDVEDDIDDEQFFLERQMCRMERQNRRSKRRCRTGGTSERVMESISGRSIDKSVDQSSSELLAYPSSSEAYLSSDRDVTTQSDTSPYPTRAYSRPKAKERHRKQRESCEAYNRPSDTDRLVAESVQRLEAMVRQDRHQGRYREFRRDDGGPRPKTSDTLGEVREVYSKRQDMQGLRSQSADSEKEKQMKRDAFRKHFRAERGSSETISRVHNQNITVPFLKLSSNNISDISKSRFDDRTQSQDFVNSRDSSLSRDYERHCRGSRGSTPSLLSADIRYARKSPNAQRGMEKTENNNGSRTCTKSLSNKRHTLTGDYNDKRMSPTKTVQKSPQPNKTRSLDKQCLSPYFDRKHTANSLSPDMALGWSPRPNRHAVVDRPGSVSPRGGSDQETRNAREIADYVDRHNRRMTLAYCVNIDTLQVADQISKDPLNGATPREIIIHRDRDDKSVRTQGLGMRVVGGRNSSNGALGAYVTMVIKGGPAATQGISEGDQIVQWNGQSLVDVTFEESQSIINSSGNIVQLTVLHNADGNNGVNRTRQRHPVIIKSTTLTAGEPPPLDNLEFGRSKRRLLPKTPVEIKREVKEINGKVWLKLDYDVTCQCLLVVLLRAESVYPDEDKDADGQGVLAMFHLLPNRTLHEAKESERRYGTKDPQWNETFVFTNIEQAELSSLALEVTFWKTKEHDDEFLGEILLDLGEAKINNSVNCYNLEDHDDNSSPLPLRKKSFSLSDSALSPATSIETSSFFPSLDPSPRSSVSTGREGQPPKSGAHDKVKELLLGKRSPGRERVDMSSSAQSSPQHSPTSNEFKIYSSFTSLVKRKIGIVTRISNNLGLGHKHEYEGHGPTDPILRSLSTADIRTNNLLTPEQAKHTRHSFELRQSDAAQSLHSMFPPKRHMKKLSKMGFDEFDDDDDDSHESPSPDRPPPDGDDITSILGPGQVCPKPAYETSVCGDIKMGFMVSKGQLEIDIVVVKGLKRSGLSHPPDTYVKTYLVEGAKTVQKKKTQTVRMSFDPMYRKTIRYSACNIHGRCIKVNVWDKQKAFDKKQCLGEAIVKLDNLVLTDHTMAWYKLFPDGAAEIGSSESLNYW